MIDWVTDLVADGGYPMILFLMALETIFPPIPSEIILPLAGFSVSEGKLGFVPALLASSAGSMLGAIALYALGRFGGRPLVLRYRRVLRLSEADLDKGEAWFSRWGPWLVFVGRMIPLVRSVISVPAGLARMPLLPFLLLSLAGTLIWNAALIGAGWALGDNWERVADALGPVGLIVAAVVAVGLLAGGIYLWRRRVRTRPVG
jgi:membrane protein DedA with SNARE-associated domain